MRGWFRKISWLAVLTVAASFLVPQEGFAQHARDLRALLQRLDTELQTAERALALIPNQALKAELERAKRLRTEAKAAFEARRYSVASAKAKEALRLLDDIRSKLLSGPVEKVVQRYQDLLRQAELLVPGSGDKETERLLNNAKKAAREARQLANQGLFEKSASKYREAIFLLQTCLERVKKGTRVQDQVRAARQRLQTLQERLSSSPQSLRRDARSRVLIRQAQDEVQRAAKAEGEERWSVALQHYNRAIRLLYRVLDQAGPSAERALEELDQLLRGWESTMPQSRANRLLWQRIENLRNEAWQALQSGKPKVAARKALLARRLLESAGLQSSGSARTRSEIVQRELERYRAALVQLRRGVAEDDFAGRQLLREAARQGRLAQRSLEQGRTRLASRHLLVGYRLLETLRSGGTRGDLGVDKVRQEIELLRSRVQDVVQERGERPFTRTALRLLDQAERASQEGEVGAASRLLEAARALLSNAGVAQSP